jgi:hypothetical protein
MAPFFWTITNSFASIARMTGSWATLSGVCREYSRYNVRMFLIDRQVQAYVRVVLRLHPRSSTPQEYHELVARKANVWDTHRPYTPPCPLQTHFPLPGPSRKNSIPSHQHAPIKNFYDIFFTVTPLSFRWHHSLAVPTLTSYCLTQSVISKKIVPYTVLKRFVISTIK